MKIYHWTTEFHWRRCNIKQNKELKSISVSKSLLNSIHPLVSLTFQTCTSINADIIAKFIEIWIFISKNKNKYNNGFNQNLCRKKGSFELLLRAIQLWIRYKEYWLPIRNIFCLIEHNLLSHNFLKENILIYFVCFVFIFAFVLFFQTWGREWIYKIAGLINEEDALVRNMFQYENKFKEWIYNAIMNPYKKMDNLYCIIINTICSR